VIGKGQVALGSWEAQLLSRRIADHEIEQIDQSTNPSRRRLGDKATRRPRLPAICTIGALVSIRRHSALSSGDRVPQATRRNLCPLMRSHLRYSMRLYNNVMMLTIAEKIMELTAPTLNPSLRSTLLLQAIKAPDPPSNNGHPTTALYLATILPTYHFTESSISP
jgi:hypothetical protein